MLPFILAILHPRLPARGLSWLDGEMTSLAHGRPLEEIRRAYASASRHAGRAELKLADEELARVHALDPDLSLSHWTIDDAARAALLLAAAKGSPLHFHDIAIACYEDGDVRTQQSWLRSLSILPQPERFLSIAIDAARTATVQLFEALACENPYPARYFPDRSFNQLVMKAIADGVALSRIAGLSNRVNADLVRMAGDYAAERKAAGRSAPPDIALVLTAAKVVTAS
jgi:hypothetical protein